jgi:cyclophilin family peptidyl-prolyl cis-trans isomerase
MPPRSRSLFLSFAFILIACFFFGSMFIILSRSHHASLNAISGTFKSNQAEAPAGSAGIWVVLNNKAVFLSNRAIIRTSMGDIVLELLHEAAPRHVHNFLSLARSGWYNDTSFYRLEKGFCLQGGGWPKKDGPSTVPLETQMYASHPNRKWAVSAARQSDPNTARAEFSIMLGDNRFDPPPFSCCMAASSYAYSIQQQMAGTGWF